jgi:hypothetical protein
MTDDERLGTTVAERYVIGALLAAPDVLRSVQEEVVPRDFSDARLGDIYAGIVQMATRREAIDYLSVWDQLAGWDVRGIDLQDLAHWATAVPTAANAPYYARIVRTAALRRDLAELGGRLQAAEDPGRALQTAIDRLHELRDRDATGAGPELRTLAQLFDVPADADAYDWVVPGLLERRDRLMLTGSEGGGKSTLLRQLAVMTAAGLHPFGGHQIEPRRVLVVDAENSERQWRRAVRSLAANAANTGVVDPRQNMWVHFEAEGGVDITRPADQGRIHRFIDQARPDLVLIGPIYKLVPKAIKDDDDAMPVLAVLETFRDHADAALMIEAHAGHGDARSGVRDLRPIGSSAFLRWPEFGLGLAKPSKPGEPHRLLRWRGDRDERAWPMELHSSRNVAQTWPWEPTGSYFMGPQFDAVPTLL